MYPQGINYPGLDPNFNRVIEDTLNIVNDVDQRLQALRVGLAQAVPHLAPTILAQQGAPYGMNVPTPGLTGRMPGFVGQAPLVGNAPFVNQMPIGAMAAGLGVPSMGQPFWGQSVTPSWTGITPQSMGPGVVGPSFRPY